MSNYPKERQPAKTPRTGRPPMLSNPKRVHILLPDYQREWIAELNQDASKYIRELIDDDIDSHITVGGDKIKTKQQSYVIRKDP